MTEIKSMAMTERFHLGLVKGESETIWYTLVIEFPIQYFVEKYHESKNAFFFFLS